MSWGKVCSAGARKIGGTKILPSVPCVLRMVIPATYCQPQVPYVSSA